MEDKIFVRQDFRLTLTGGKDIGTAGTAIITYIREGDEGNEKSVAAIVQTPTTAVCYKDFTVTDITTAGNYRFWLDLTFSDGKTRPGQYYRRTIYARGT